jgi:hypothetical protein
MKCPRCQHENPQDSRFCFDCGSRLTPACDNCGAELPAAVKFCNRCGQAVGQPAVGSRSVSPESYTPKHLAEKILTSKSALEGERKQVTVLFADLKGSMELLADRDPRGGAEAPRPRPRAHDGGCPPLRGHGQSGDGRRDHGALRRTGRARGSRRARVLCGAQNAGEREKVRGRGASLPRGRGQDPRRAELRRGRRALDRERPAHGLHRGGPDHALGRPHAWSSSPIPARS